MPETGTGKERVAASMKLLCRVGLHIPYRRIGYTTYECRACPKQWVGPAYMRPGPWEAASLRLLEKRKIGATELCGWKLYPDRNQARKD